MKNYDNRAVLQIEQMFSTLLYVDSFDGCFETKLLSYSSNHVFDSI